MKCFGQRIAFMNIATERLCFVLKDEALSVSDFGEILDGVYTRQCSSRTIFFT